MDAKKPVIITPERKEEDQQPFVNDECGDSMWDDVLEEQDKKISANDSSEKPENTPTD